MQHKLRIGILGSGRGSNAQAIMDACQKHQIDGEIVCVGSDNPEAFILERARGAGTPTFVLPYKAHLILAKTSRGRLSLGVPHDFNEQDSLKKMALEDTEENRIKIRILAIAEVDLLDYLKKYRVDLLVCAGFMRLLTSYFLDHFQPDPLRPRVMNIHPALLPAFPGLHAQRQALEHGVKISGCTVHYVNTGVDTGAIIVQKQVPVLEGDDEDSLSARILEKEHEAYPEAINLHLQKRLRVKGRIVEVRNPKRFAGR